MLAIAIERIGTPIQLLRGETDEPAMGGYGGQRPAETEAVGQEDVGAFHTQFVAIELLP